jgi:hypothetical protein
VQIAVNAHAVARWLAVSALVLILTLLSAGGPAVTPAVAQGKAQDKPEVAAAATVKVEPKPAAKAEPKKKAKAKKKAKVKKKARSKKHAKSKKRAKAKKSAKAKQSAKQSAKPESKAAAKPKTESESVKADAVKDAPPEQPGVVVAAQLPGAIRTMHICAGKDDKVDFGHESYGKSVVFFVSCPPVSGKLTPFVVYVAGDTKADDAKRVTFELLAADGTPASQDTIPSVVPARAAYTKPGEDQPNMNTKEDEVWLVGAWRPDDDPARCAVSANWRLQGDKAELQLWEEATECPPGAVPKYVSKIDKKPPPLVGR